MHPSRRSSRRRDDQPVAISTGSPGAQVICSTGSVPVEPGASALEFLFTCFVDEGISRTVDQRDR